MEVEYVKVSVMKITAGDAKRILYGLLIASKSVGPNTYDQKIIAPYIKALREFIAENSGSSYTADEPKGGRVRVSRKRQ